MCSEIVIRELIRSNTTLDQVCSMRQWLTTFLDNRTKAASNLVSNYRISNVTTNGVGHCSRMVASYEGQP